MALHKPPIPVGTAKVVCSGQNPPSTWANVFYFAVGTWDPAHLDDVVSLIGEAMVDFYQDAIGLGAFATTWTLDTTKIAFRDAADSLYRATVADALAGGGAATSESAQVSLLVNWTSNDARRGGKPRQYLAGVSEGIMDDPVHVHPASRTSMNSGITAWLTEIAAAVAGTAHDLALLEMSFRDALTWRDTAHTWPIRGGTVSAECATQRRRLDRTRV